MNNLLRILSLLIFVSLIIIGCSEDKNPLPSTSHPDGWMTASAENFHGTKVLEVTSVSCKSCHGADLDGGNSNISCYNSSCHTTYPHAPEWNLIPEDGFHGKYVTENAGSIDNCKSCHGSDLAGGKTKISCFGCHAQGSLDL